MYYIMAKSGLIITFSGSKDKVWKIGKKDNLESYKSTVRILDYSDWSIETVFVTDLMNAIESGRLKVSDFLNLEQMGIRYEILDSRIFHLYRVNFTTKDFLMRQVVYGKIMEIEFNNGACLSISQSTEYSAKLIVNYKEAYARDIYGFFANGYGLVPIRNGYKFCIGHNAQVVLEPDCFNIKCGSTIQSFKYVNKGELARRKLMLRV